jgi:major membrane immunogen (membrane-anchored lipoprotein)
MKKYLTLSLILASSFLLSACGTKNSTTSNQTANNNQKAFSLRELIAQNIPQKCIYSGTNQDGTFKSEIIISGQKFNQTVNITTATGETETFYTISDGEYYYNWGTSQGHSFATKMKANFASAEDESNQDTESYNQATAVDLDNNFQGTCSPTTVSDAEFQPPTDVDFTDYSQMMEDWQNMIPSGITDLE